MAKRKKVKKKPVEQQRAAQRTPESWSVFRAGGGFGFPELFIIRRDGDESVISSLIPESMPPSEGLLGGWFERAFEQHKAIAPTKVHIDLENFQPLLDRLPLSVAYELKRFEMQERVLAALNASSQNPTHQEGRPIAELLSAAISAMSQPAPAEDDAESAEAATAEAATASEEVEMAIEAEAAVEGETETPTEKAANDQVGLTAEAEALIARCRETYDAGPSVSEEQARLAEISEALSNESDRQIYIDALDALLGELNERKRFARAMKKALAEFR